MTGEDDCIRSVCLSACETVIDGERLPVYSRLALCLQGQIHVLSEALFVLISLSLSLTDS